MDTTIDKNFFVSQHDAKRKQAFIDHVIANPLPDMTWNQDLFCKARCSPKRCSSMSAQAHDSGGYQNLAFEPYGIQQWYDESKDPAGDDGHLRNMMNTAELGCNYQACGPGTGIVDPNSSEMRCNYSGSSGGGIFPFD